MNIGNEIFLITGASSGIGKELTLKLCTENKVVACSRDSWALSELAKLSPNIIPLRFDVTDEASIVNVKKQLEGIVTHVDRVILNAGDCIYTLPESIDWSVYTKMVNVNFLGWINTLQLCFDLLKKSTSAHIIGISSQVVYAPFTQASAYGASKAAASYFLSSLRLDILKDNIDTTLIYPGFVHTPLTQKNTFPMPFMVSCDTAAERIINAISKRKRSCVFPKRLRYILLMSKFFPWFWESKMSYKGH